MYSYTVCFDTLSHSGSDGDDAWERDICPVTITSTKIKYDNLDLNMLTAFGVIHEEHSQWLNLVMNNDLAGYKTRLHYRVEILCECGRWVTPEWKCQACFKHAHNADCHSCN